jgi:hypothetical protein
MDELVTEQELDAIESRCSLATPAPWTSYWEGRDHWGGSSFIMQQRDGRQCDLYLTFDYSPRSEASELADQDFIAHAREDLPRVLAEVRRLKIFIASQGLDDRVV